LPRNDSGNGSQLERGVIDTAMVWSSRGNARWSLEVMMVAWFRAGTYQNKSRHSFLMRLVNRRASLRLLCRDRVRDSREFHRGTQLLTSYDSTALLFSVDHLHWHCFFLPSSLWTSAVVGGPGLSWASQKSLPSLWIAHGPG